jgi:methyl-accepting chemotaxis protein
MLQSTLPETSTPQRRATTVVREPLRGVELRAELIALCREAANGNLEPRIQHFDEDDDLSPICHALNHLLDMTDAFVREAGASLEHASRDQYHRRMILRGMRGAFRRAAVVINDASAQMGKRSRELAAIKQSNLDLAASFEFQVKGVADTVASASTELQASAATLSSTADETCSRADVGANAARSTAANVQTVAVAAEELSASVDEITRTTLDAAAIAHKAVDVARGADSKIADLEVGAQRIGRVVKLIGEIARQTNLLALNASIEAARAGNAGRGFAVVANEVKTLARQTAQATDEVSKQIDGIRVATTSVVEAVSEMRSSLEAVNSATEAITFAVEQQGLATREIATTIDRVSADTRTMSDAVEGVSETARLTEEASVGVLGAAADLSKQSVLLSSEVEGFLRALRK